MQFESHSQIYIDLSGIYIRIVETAYWNWIGESTERAGPFSKMQPNKRANKRARVPYDKNFICSTLSRDNAPVIIHIFFQFMLSSVALLFIPHFLFCLSFFSFVAFRHCFSFVAVLSTSFSRMTFKKCYARLLCTTKFIVSSDQKWISICNRTKWSLIYFSCDSRMHCVTTARISFRILYMQEIS